MKNLKLIFTAIFMFAFVGPFGTALAFGASFLAGSVSSGLTMANPLDISEVNSVLGAYMRKFEKEIWRLATQDIQLENYMTKVPGISDEYVTYLSKNGEFLQAKQPGWQPKGGVSFHPRINKVRQIKMDYTLEDQDLNQLFTSHLAYLATEEGQRDKWPIVKYIVMEHIIPGIREEISKMSAFGEYVAPTPGTAGLSINAVDGILTVVDNEIAASNLGTLTTGEFDIDNVVDQIEGFVDQQPVKYRHMAGTILASPEVVKLYWRGRRKDFGQNMDYKAIYDGIPVEGTKKIIVAIDEFAGTQRIIETPKKNLLCMYDKVYVPSSPFVIQQDKRDLHILTDFKRGYGFATLEDIVFVNDVAVPEPEGEEEGEGGGGGGE
jgi:hypothetical protein